MKENIIRYNMYATYDRIANTIGIPFISQNNATALRMLENTKKKMKEEGLEVGDDLSIMYLGQYTMTPIKIQDIKGVIKAFEPVFTDIDNAYDILDCFEDSRERETEEIMPEHQQGIPIPKVTNNVWESEE